MKDLSSKYIVIEGPIGVGKTSLANKLALEWDAELILENVDDNPFLSKFYKNQREVSFQTQLYFLLTFIIHTRIVLFFPIVNPRKSNLQKSTFIFYFFRSWITIKNLNKGFNRNIALSHSNTS